ncbi:class Ib ribonucleoside-diphosphate reductase assembly flavoprotein NrdI [Galactobacter caseinivorans]|uniref:Protein NrdI n=1 Tax=Galactobacter caseinivorans TaxID=2676123 RepID=A0A496PH45_9MICC|nr:class Ib ribonucleoside-diphosphate reductase assembly flavoprotein NrdI [Galactobacter caseinivorans]RKW69805.1 class Ib ribonucleoside-diphosphate reductase assembly flavoprotein NrdI [Galactobacter caseinivorans]
MRTQQTTQANPAKQPTERLVYFSSVSENTKRFVGKLNHPADRIPLHKADPELVVDRDYVLVIPTYGGEKGEHAVPPQVLRFLRHPQNRDHLAGVIGAGNTNFGTTYNLAAHKIAKKLSVPVLYLFELMGTPEDVARVNQGLDEFWTRQSQSRP